MKVVESDLGRKPEAHVESQRANAPGESSELDASFWSLCPDGSELTAPPLYQPCSLLFLQSHVKKLCSAGGAFP